MLDPLLIHVFLLLMISDAEKCSNKKKKKFTFENCLFCFILMESLFETKTLRTEFMGWKVVVRFFWFYEYFQTDLSKCYEKLASKKFAKHNICMRHLNRTKKFQQQHIETSNTPSKFQLRISISYEKFSSLTDFLWEFSTQWLFTSQSIPKLYFLIRLKRIPFCCTQYTMLLMKLQLILDNNFQHIFWDSWF